MLDRCIASGVLDLVALLTTALEVSEALAALHAHDVVHGDLTPSNVLLSSKGDLASRAGRGFVVKVGGRRGSGAVNHLVPYTLITLR